MMITLAHLKDACREQRATLLPARCYSCGWIGHHRHACPDHPANRVPMGETEFARLIPVGTWWARSAATFRQQEARRR